MYAVVQVEGYDGPRFITTYATKQEAIESLPKGIRGCEDYYHADDDWICYSIIGPLTLGVKLELNP